ncbi:MAG: MBL fold metallo-hydrolase [Halanaerobiales bacterium]
MSEIFIKALGTAQDGGYPQPGCTCPNCREALQDPRRKRSPASLGISLPKIKKHYIIDPTPAFNHQLNLLNNNNRESKTSSNPLAGVFISHAHMGHYSGLMYLGKEAINTDNLPVYTSPRMEDFLKNNHPWSGLLKNKNIKINQFKPDKKIYFKNNLEITPIKVPHRAEYTDTFGFIIRGNKNSLFYLPDIDGWQGFEDKFNHISSTVDYMILDGTFYTRDELTKHRNRNIKKVPHPTIKHTIKELKNERLKQNDSKIFFTHFNHTNRVLDPTFDTSVLTNTSLLKEGMTISI